MKYKSKEITILAEKLSNPMEKNCSVLISYEVTNHSKEYEFFKIIEILLESPFYEKMRTEE